MTAFAPMVPTEPTFVEKLYVAQLGVADALLVLEYPAVPSDCGGVKNKIILGFRQVFIIY
jgi:hypothetical protein